MAVKSVAGLFITRCDHLQLLDSNQMHADIDMLSGAISFDYIMVQFYNNNYCGVSSIVSGGIGNVSGA